MQYSQSGSLAFSLSSFSCSNVDLAAATVVRVRSLFTETHAPKAAAVTLIHGTSHGTPTSASPMTAFERREDSSIKHSLCTILCQLIMSAIAKENNSLAENLGDLAN